MTGTQMGGGGGGGGVWLSLFSSALSEAVMSDSGKFIYLSTQSVTQAEPEIPISRFPSLSLSVFYLPFQQSLELA